MKGGFSLTQMALIVGVSMVGERLVKLGTGKLPVPGWQKFLAL